MKFLKAITEVRSGGAPMTSEIARMLVEAFQKKTSQSDFQRRAHCSGESEILVLLLEGFSNKEIAERVTISYGYMAWAHLRHIDEKLACARADGGGENSI